MPNVLIDSGATCNLLGQGTWKWLKSQKIQCQTRKEAKALFPYGNTKPLPTLGTFSTDIMSTDTGATCKTDFVADASPVGLGAVLTQLRGSEWGVIGYTSRRLSDV